jgi:cyclopropane-fatty-acyl-phospholipid synthase
LLEKLFDKGATRKVAVRLWDGSCWPDDTPRLATTVLNHPGALRAMFLPPTEVGLAEAYLYDDFDVEGDIEVVFELAEMLSETATCPLWKLNLARDLLHLPAGQKGQTTRRGPSKLSGEVHSIERDRQAIAYHYDVSNDFYALWLDRRMVYSCAYFTGPDDDLDTAQERKLDYICRKLCLQPGQRLLDVGCGWGGLADQCRVYVQDYREVDGAEQYDALVSVGMFEHVGAALLPTYFSQAGQLLKPGGVFLNHSIANRATDKRSRGRITTIKLCNSWTNPHTASGACSCLAQRTASRPGISTSTRRCWSDRMSAGRAVCR